VKQAEFLDSLRFITVVAGVLLLLWIYRKVSN